MFKQSSLLLNEKGILKYYTTDPTNQLKDKEFNYINKLNDQINEAMIINRNSTIVYNDNDNDKLNDSLDDLLTKAENEYSNLPTKDLYQNIIENELKNYEMRQYINSMNSDVTEEDLVNMEDSSKVRDTKKTTFNKMNTINIKDSLIIDNNVLNFKNDNDIFYNTRKTLTSNFNLKNFKNSVSLNFENNFIPVNNLNGNVSNDNFNYNKNLNNDIVNSGNIPTTPKNKRASVFSIKNNLENNQENITKTEIFNTKTSGFPNMTNDFKTFRQSGFIINSDFVKKDESKYNDNPEARKLKHLENLYEKVSKKDVAKEEIINYFHEFQIKGFSYDEKR